MIFCDLGAYSGDTVEQFINWGQLLGDISDAKIYAFDPNPRFIAKWQDVHDRHIKHVKEINFEQRAAWTSDGDIEFTLRPESAPYGSTVMKEKRDWGMGEILKVPCFDFSNWLKQFKGEEVLIKMDCEGSELPILTKMIEDKTDDIATITMVEWHDDKMPTYESNKAWILDNYRGKILEWR